MRNEWSPAGAEAIGEQLRGGLVGGGYLGQISRGVTLASHLLEELQVGLRDLSNVGWLCRRHLLDTRDSILNRSAFEPGIEMTGFKE
jgi:hypothetical protein